MVFAFGARVDLLDVLLDAGAVVHADDWEAIPFPGPYQQLDLAPLARELKRGGVHVDGLVVEPSKRRAWWSRREACFARLSSRGVVIKEKFRPTPITRTPLLHQALKDGAQEAFEWLTAHLGTGWEDDASLLTEAMSAVARASKKEAAAALGRLNALLRAGLDPNSGLLADAHRKKRGKQPAFYDVVGSGSPRSRAMEVLLALKAAGADFTRPGPYGFDMVTWACAHRALDLAQMLGRPSSAALGMACDPRLAPEGRLAVAEWVLGHDVDLEATSDYFFNETALVMAIRSHDRALVDLLIARGARMDATDRHGVPAAKLIEQHL